MEEERLPEYTPTSNPPQPTATNSNTDQRQLWHANRILGQFWYFTCQDGVMRGQGMPI